MSTIAGLRWTAMWMGLLLAAVVQAQTTVGRTEGSASVTATGAARYAVPLALPPGTSGLAPSLAVVYDSRGGNGLLGVGFQLAGLSSIRRCGNTLAQDGKVSTVALDATDRFCLDGQRLRLASGTYGAAGSVYHTEVESFARITAYGTAGSGPAYFRVEQRNGLIYEYGATTASRVEASGSLTAREWALNRIRDRDGNYADVVYLEDTAAGSHRPSRIDYAGNLNTGATPYYSVRFVYEVRPAVDQPSGYLAGGPLGETTRIDRIDVAHISSGRVVRSFDFGYQASPASGRSRLASLQECVGTTCLPATQFGWTAASPGWSGALAPGVAATSFAAAIPGDMDGDGFDDLAYQDPTTRQWMVLRGGSGGFLGVPVATGLGQDSDGSQAIGADVDGDGRRDVLVPGSGSYWHRLRWTPSGAFAYTATGVVNPAPAGGLIATDVDGDGRDDLVYVKSAGDALYWRRNLTVDGSAYAAEAVLWTVPANTRLPAAPFIETAQRFRSIARSGDFNGDSRMDLLVLAQQAYCAGLPDCTGWTNRWIVLASNGSALAAQYSYDGNSESLLGDFNGDGLTDIGYWKSGGAWQLLFGAGTREVTLTTFAGPYATTIAAPAAGGRSMVVDWDADGRADLLQWGSTGELSRCRSTGRSLEACQLTGIAPGAVPSSTMTFDANGDGFADLGYVASGVRLNLHQSVPPDLLASVTDGLGARSEFEYAPLTNPTVHRTSGTVTYPVRHYVRPGRVVSRATRAGSDGVQQEAYYYEGGKLHAQGRGFLGFARRVVSTTNGNPIRVEDYLQDPAAYESIGAPSVLTLQNRYGARLDRTTYTWTRQTNGAGYEGRAIALPAGIRVERFDPDGTLVSSTVTTSTFDSYGTATRRQTITTEHARGLNPGAQHIETMTLWDVVNDTVNWCFGRPATTIVSRQHSLPGGTAVNRSFGHAWDYARCRATQQVVEPQSTTLRVTSDFAYDGYGNLNSLKVTPVGQAVRTTAYSWAQNGRFPGAQVNAEGHTTTMAWDAVFGRPASVTDPNGLVSGVQYDELGRVTRESQPDGTSTVTTRSACGTACPWPSAVLVVSWANRAVGDAVIVSGETGYDAYGRVVYAMQDQPGGAAAWSVRGYDARGLLAQESIAAPCCSAPGPWVRHGYDDYGRRVSTERPASSDVPTPVFTRWRYDGLAVIETDVLGRATTYHHDALGNVLQVVDPAFADTDYEYDAFGNLVKIRDVTGSETLISYDYRGNRRSITDPGAGARTFDYWPAGELKSQTNARGQVTSYSYDRLSRPLSRTEPEGTTTWTWGTAAASRNIGALASIASPGFQESYQYDSYGRPATVTTTIAGTSLVTRQSYHATTGLPDVMTYPGATPLRVRHEYDRGRLVRLADADSGVTYWQLNSVDGGGQVTDEIMGNGVRVLSAFDAVTGRLASRTAGLGGGTTHQNLGYTWDAAGNLSSREERNRGVQERFYYDVRDRLDYVTRGGSVVLDLGYDDVGNLTFKSDVGTYRYDAIRKQAAVAAGANTYAYDANGAVVNASGTAINWFSYELPGQFSHPAGNSSSFQYGADRSRFRQVASAGGVTTETLYAAGGLYERATTGSVAKHRYYIVADGRRVAVQTRESGKSPVTVYLLADHLGGVDGLVSQAGALLARSSYQPFGARRSGDWLSSAPTAAEWQQIKAATPRGFTDHEHLDNLGVVHMNGRVYDPVLGRFLSPDPLMQAPYDTQGLNRYAYVRNNPLRYTDPSGLCLIYDPLTDGIQQGCLEVVVTGSRLGGWGPYQSSMSRFETRGTPEPGNPFGGRPETSGGRPDRDNGSVDIPEEVVVTAPRIDPHADAPASPATWWSYVPPWVGASEYWKYLDEAMLVAGFALAALEPTPYGEVAMSALAMGSFGRGAITSIAFGPMNPGPLSAGIAATFRGGAYSEVVYGQSVLLYRVFGGRAGQIGSFWTATPPTGALRSRIDLALSPQWGNTASQVVRINVPAGTRMYTGYAASQGGLVGGGSQVYVPYVNPAWIIK